MLPLEQAFQSALKHHQAGRLTQAEQLYRQVLARQPNHADALHLLGVIAAQVGRSDAAVDLIRRAISIKPNWPDAHNNLGNALNDKGQADEAIAAYRQAIALRPNYPQACCNLGNALKARGQLDEAIASYRRAIRLKPDYADACNNLGNALKDQGNLDESIAAYRQAIILRPSYAEAHGNLASALIDNGQLDEAIASCRQAIALKANYPEAHCNLGNALKDKGQFDEAIAAYRQAIGLKPDYPEAHSNVGVALKNQGQLDEAIAAFRHALALDPSLAMVRSNLGNALQDKGQLDEAIAAFREAIALDPSLALAHNNLGSALKDKGQLDEAIAAYRRAISLEPDYAEAHSNLGNALKDKGQVDEPIAGYRRAIALDPSFGMAHWNLALALLVRGDFSQGWEEYEWRCKCKDFPSPPQRFPQPPWDGRPLGGDTLLLHAEQGFGDTLQFIRYLPLVAQRAGKIIVACQSELQRLIQAMAGDYPVVARSQPLPEFDVHCPLLSLPRLFGTTLESIPRQVPYVHADVARVEKWRERLAEDAGPSEARSPFHLVTPSPCHRVNPSNPLKIGLAWAGNKTHAGDRSRSMALSAFAPLARLTGIRFYSLQKGESAQQARNAPEGLQLIDRTDELQDFADTAALIANLDLVISVDTAVVHLAGAMGKPVWVLLPFSPDWRWLLDREDSPWYPTLRLFRQPAIGDWGSVIGKVAESLAALTITSLQSSP